MHVGTSKDNRAHAYPWSTAVSDLTPAHYVPLAVAAELMAVSVKTVRRRIADGTLPAYRCGRRVIRVRIEDLERVFHRIPSAHL